MILISKCCQHITTERRVKELGAVSFFRGAVIGPRLRVLAYKLLTGEIRIDVAWTLKLGRWSPELCWLGSTGPDACWDRAAREEPYLEAFGCPFHRIDTALSTVESLAVRGRIG